jgi:chemotaxis signal transduction protein
MLTPKYLVFRISGQKFAVKYSNVVEITSVRQPVKVMHSGQSFIDTHKSGSNTNYQMVDLRSYLGINPQISKKNSVIVVSSEANGIKRNFGLLVDEVNGMFELDSFTFYPYRTLISKSFKDIREAIAIINNEPIVILNPNKIQYLFEPMENSFAFTIALLN